MIEIIGFSILGVICLFFLSVILYSLTGFNRWFFDRILGWHKPNDKVGFDGVSLISTCKYCGKKIMQDGQGNWFEVEDAEQEERKNSERDKTDGD